MLNLTVKERLLITGILNSFRGSLSGLVYVLEDIKKINIVGEDAKKINLREEPKGSGIIKWDIESDIEISLNNPTKEFILKYINEKDEKGEIELNDAPLIHIKELLEKE